MDRLVGDLARDSAQAFIHDEKTGKKANHEQYKVNGGGEVLGDLKPREESNKEAVTETDQEIIVQPSKLNLKMRHLLRGRTVSSTDTPTKEVRDL